MGAHDSEEFPRVSSRNFCLGGKLSRGKGGGGRALLYNVCIVENVAGV